MRVSDGSVVWTHDLDTTGYSTPAVADGRIYVGDFNGLIHAYRASDGTQLWQTYVGGRVLAPGLIVGPLVFFSNLETKTFGLRRSDGKVVWHVPMGKYRPGIATDRSLLLHAERAARRLPGDRSAQEESGGCRRRQAGDRRKARLEAFQALTRARYQPSLARPARVEPVPAP